MKSTILLLQAVVFCFVAAGFSGCSKPDASTRKPKLYQSPMHPWITSDKPGNCTICGMQLVPVYDDKPHADDSNLLDISPGTARAIGLTTAKATVGPLEKSIRLSGILEDDDTLHRVVAAFYDGRIEQVYVQQVGEKVKAGQPLASIYSPELLYVVREYQNAAARGKADPVAVNSRHRLIQYGLSPAQVDGLATATRDRYALDLLAPMDGTILVRNAYQGQYVKNGERLFEMGNLARLWFKAEVYERDLPVIRTGLKAVITSPAAPGRSFDGVVTFLDPNFDPGSRSTKIRIEVDNPLSDRPGAYERVLPHRAYAEAEILAVSEPVLNIPRAALVRDGRREVVYVEKAPGEFEMRAVKAGRSGDGSVEIVSGLAAGDTVVASGNLLLDAEAQLRGGGSETIAPTKQLPGTVVEFLRKLSALSGALASDDLSAAQKELPVSLGEPPAGADAEISAAWTKLRGLPPLEKAGDLPAFRKEFHTWSTAAAGLVLELKSAGYDVPFHVFECPMTGGSFPGAPKSARWVQIGDKTLNPYLGMDMQTCGQEVEP
jgi:Cu(I)/Ag(I) efflux system membrane fusion protein